MPKPTKGPRLGGGPAHERLMLANLASALFTHKSITTTETKAKRLRPYAERMVTFAKRGDLHARRRVLSSLPDKTAVHLLFTEIAPLVAEREGGYTRITKIGNRKGDNAPMAVIELVLEPVTKKPTSPKKVAAKAEAEKAAQAKAAKGSAAAAEVEAEAADLDAAEAETAVAEEAETVEVLAAEAEAAEGDAIAEEATVEAAEDAAESEGAPAAD